MINRNTHVKIAAGAIALALPFTTVTLAGAAESSPSPTAPTSTNAATTPDAGTTTDANNTVDNKTPITLTLPGKASATGNTKTPTTTKSTAPTTVDTKDNADGTVTITIAVQGKDRAGVTLIASTQDGKEIARGATTTQGIVTFTVDKKDYKDLKNIVVTSDNAKLSLSGMTCAAPDKSAVALPKEQANKSFVEALREALRAVETAPTPAAPKGASKDGKDASDPKDAPSTPATSVAPSGTPANPKPADPKPAPSTPKTVQPAAQDGEAANTATTEANVTVTRIPSTEDITKAIGLLPRVDDVTGVWGNVKDHAADALVAGGVEKDKADQAVKNINDFVESLTKGETPVPAPVDTTGGTTVLDVLNKLQAEGVLEPSNRVETTIVNGGIVIPVTGGNVDCAVTPDTGDKETPSTDKPSTPAPDKNKDTDKNKDNPAPTPPKLPKFSLRDFLPDFSAAVRLPNKVTLSPQGVRAASDDREVIVTDGTSVGPKVKTGGHAVTLRSLVSSIFS